MIKIIACQSIKEELLNLNKEINKEIDIEFVQYDYHNTPEKLRQELQKRIDEENEADIIVLGYGLCSNAVVGLSGKQRIVIPAVHDCVSLLLGSAERYQEEFSKSPETFYLSRGWIDYGSDPMKEFFRYTERYGEENAKWLISDMYKAYNRLVLIDTGVCNEEHIVYSQKVAEFMQWKFEKVVGSGKVLKKLIEGKWDQDFWQIKPGGKVKEDMCLVEGTCFGRR